MKTETIRVMLTGGEAELVDLNDWAINTVREYARGRGYNAAALISEETARINDGGLGLDDYRAVRRIGSHHLLSRSVRNAVWAIVATRRMLGVSS